MQPHNMKPYQERVIAEYKDLQSKLIKLSAMIEGPAFGTLKLRDQDLLKRQLKIMTDYERVLAQRIEEFD